MKRGIYLYNFFGLMGGALFLLPMFAFACSPPQGWSQRPIVRATSNFLTVVPFEDRYGNLKEYTLLYREPAIATCPATSHWVKTAYLDTLPPGSLEALRAKAEDRYTNILLIPQRLIPLVAAGLGVIIVGLVTGGIWIHRRRKVIAKV